MRIENGDLCIRSAEADDCPQLAKWWNDGSVMAHAGFQKVRVRENAWTNQVGELQSSVDYELVPKEFIYIGS